MKNLPNIFLFFPRISQCSAIKYLSINFHNNMCMNKTFWFGKYVCTHADDEHTMCHLSSSRKTVFEWTTCWEWWDDWRNNEPFKVNFCVAQQIFMRCKSANKSELFKTSSLNSFLENSEQVEFVTIAGIEKSITNLKCKEKILEFPTLWQVWRKICWVLWR